MISQERLKELLHYDPETGMFTWINPPKQHSQMVGKRAGFLKPDRSGAYRKIKIDKFSYQAARLAVLYMTGHFPAEQVDHINLDKSDDRWCNLREVTQEQNRANVRRYSNNTSGIKGVSPHGEGWTAVLQVNGEYMYLGKFKEKYEAAAIYAVASELFHGEHGRTC